MAADVKLTSYLAGHHTEFPSDEKIILAQLPFAINQVQHRIVLHDDPCGSRVFIGNLTQGLVPTLLGTSSFMYVRTLSRFLKVKSNVYYLQ